MSIRVHDTASYAVPESRYAGDRSGSLADILERVLDRGVVIAGDIGVSVLDIEVLTLKVRLLIASADTARQMGIDWWVNDPFLSSNARALRAENDELKARLEALESRMLPGGDRSGPADEPARQADEPARKADEPARGDRR